MYNKLFNCKVVLFKKSKIFIRNDSFGDFKNEQINIFYLIYFLIFKGTKRRINNYKLEYYDSLLSKFVKWFGNRLNNLIDNCFQTIGAGFVGYLLLKYFSIY